MFWSLGELVFPWALFILSNMLRRRRSVLVTEQNFIFGFYCVILFNDIHWMRKNNTAKLFQSGLCTTGSQFNSVQSLSCVRLFATPWIAACQASLSITNSRTSFIFTSIESVMPSSHLILSHHLFLLPPIPPSIKVFSNESTLHMRWPKLLEFQL